MEESLTRLDLPVSTADAFEIQRLCFENGRLIIDYIDWQEKQAQITFNEVVAYLWKQEEVVEHAGDAIYEVENSTWLNELRSTTREAGSDADYHELWEARSPRHYQLYFNALGILEVVADSLAYKNSAV